MGRLIRGLSKNARFFVADTTDVAATAPDNTRPAIKTIFLPFLFDTH